MLGTTCNPKGREHEIQKQTPDSGLCLCINAANDDGATSTKIIYNVFLSYSQLKEYLSLLLRSDLIKYHTGRRTLVITEKGVHLLELYNSLNKVVSIRQITAPSVSFIF